MGTLYYGDNLDILRRYLKDETVDLVYLDPPFNSAQNYNAFFQEKDGTAAASQIRAFEDTWTWNQESQRVYEELILQPGKVSEVMQAFKSKLCKCTQCGLTKKAEPPPTRDVNRDSGTASANGGPLAICRSWLRRLVRPHGHLLVFFSQGN
jgi:hypothetical protein